MRAVNLLPRDLARERARSGRLPALVAAGGAAAVTTFAAVAFMSASGSVADQRSQLESVEAAIARIPQAAEPVVAPGTVTQERSDRAAALSAALATRAPVDRLLRELAYVLPEDAWLTGLSANAPSPVSPAGAPTGAAAGTPGVTIQGATYSHRSVARVLARFAALPTLTGVRLTASARVAPAAEADVAGTEAKKARKQRAVVTFTITAGLRTGGPA
jgi:Tfp pilus assembly protein PilN